MKIIKSDLTNLGIFAIIWISIGLFHLYELELFILLEIIALAYIYTLSDRDVLYYYLVGSMAYFLEFLPVLMGAWIYSNAYFIVPIWISPLAGFTFIVIRFTVFKVNYTPDNCVFLRI